MEIDKIHQEPQFQHALTEQEITDMRSVTDGERKLALAKDWSIIRQELSWIKRRLIVLNNVVSEMEAAHAQRKAIWKLVGTIGTVVAAGGGLYGLSRLLGHP